MSDDIGVEEFKKKTIVGLTEKIVVRSNSNKKELIAKIDTGATKSSIDLSLACDLKLGPVLDSRLIKSAHGTKLRPLVEAEITLHGRILRAKFTLADRSHMKYPVLIGQNILKKGFLIDPSRRIDNKKSKDFLSEESPRISHKRRDEKK